MRYAIWIGFGLAVLSGAANGSFALPMKYLRKWRWENVWLVFTLFALFVFPWVLALSFVPHCLEVFRTVPASAFFFPMLFGALWGIAQVTYGQSIIAVGMGLAIAVVVGLTGLLGSLVPLLVLHPASLFRPGGIVLLSAMPVLLIGLVLLGFAGHARDREQITQEPSGSSRKGFARGLALCIFTGVFGAAINLGFVFSSPIVHRSVELGASATSSTYAVWAIVLTAGWIPNILYCSYLLKRDRTFHLFRERGAAREYGLGVVMAVLWLSGIIGYGIGSTLIGIYGTSAGFAAFIAAIILASNIVGLWTGEWASTSARTRRLLFVALGVILVSVAIVGVAGSL